MLHLVLRLRGGPGANRFEMSGRRKLMRRELGSTEKFTHVSNLTAKSESPVALTELDEVYDDAPCLSSVDKPRSAGMFITTVSPASESPRLSRLKRVKTRRFDGERLREAPKMKQVY